VIGTKVDLAKPVVSLLRLALPSRATGAADWVTDELPLEFYMHSYLNWELGNCAR